MMSIQFVIYLLWISVQFHVPEHFLNGLIILKRKYANSSFMAAAAVLRICSTMKTNVLQSVTLTVHFYLEIYRFQLFLINLFLLSYSITTPNRNESESIDWNLSLLVAQGFRKLQGRYKKLLLRSKNWAMLSFRLHRVWRERQLFSFHWRLSTNVSGLYC
jgi:hypothetical protein